MSDVMNNRETPMASTCTFLTAFALGERVRLSPHWPGDVPLVTPWYVSGITVSALDTGQRWASYTVADKPKSEKHRQYLTSVRWDMLSAWEE